MSKIRIFGSNMYTTRPQGGGDKKEGGTYKFYLRGASPKKGDSNRQSQSLHKCFRLPGGKYYPADKDKTSGCH